MRSGMTRWTLAHRAGLLVLLTWTLAPILWQASTALKPDAQITSSPLVYLPDPPTWDHIRALFARKPMTAYLWNSLVVSTLATLLALAVGAAAAAGLVRARSGHRDRMLLAFLSVSLFPPILLLFPLYESVRALGWINHPAALIFPYAALNVPLAVWILENAFRQIPRELDEAARLDGLSIWRRLLKVQLPLAAPSLVSAGILVFLFCWNEFMLSLSFLTRDSAKTVTAGIASVSGASLYEIPWGQLSAAILTASLPPLLLVLLLERWIVSGVTRGAVKG